MAKTRIFFPQSTVDQALAYGRAVLTDDELTWRPDATRWRVVPALHVLRETTGVGDAFELVGKVKSRAFLDALDATLDAARMRIGAARYDVVPGWLGVARLAGGSSPPSSPGPPRTPTPPGGDGSGRFSGST